MVIKDLIRFHIELKHIWIKWLDNIRIVIIFNRMIVIIFNRIFELIDVYRFWINKIKIFIYN